MRKSLTIFFACVLIIVSGYAQVVQPSASNGWKFVSVSTKEARINLSKTANVVATYNNITGDPSLSIRTNSNLNDITGAATGWGFTTIATANWGQYSSLSSVDGITGMTGIPFFPGTTSALATAAFYNFGSTSPATYNASLPQMKVTGLNTAKSYEIKITGADGTFSFLANPQRYRVIGATSPVYIDVNGNVTSQSAGATFTVLPDALGEITIYCNTVAAISDLCMVQGLTIKEL